MQLSDPDDNVKLPHLHLIEANVRLLFSREMRIREEAVFRLAYSLTSDAHANRYIPNIESISEVLPNNICLADHIYDSQSHQFNDIYEVSGGQSISMKAHLYSILRSIFLLPEKLHHTND